ncbi:ABC transporter substrate-binding protein [Micromonospora sp. DR5-3]|uniref:ABC transporter substrate-binding protein n=1 Tax=unclassified Micromonospora TaxID=2617518 RepID=UPI0011DB6DE0|nr:MULTISPECIES: ABC transporter substrate-binding protein [unclassified Micromonospora]MCW3820226.1 ABC transporter substrate-binding protein [Micromonospora sp. DR5-3]TYC19683.1 ABC transporter substrate-binding protein [Micromonospora sp. MP36]
MSRRTPRLFATALAVGALLLGGCAEKTATDTPAAGGSSAAAAFPATVGKLTLEKRPEKIVSLSPSATEMLFAIGAGKQVVAVDDQSNYPPEAPKSDLSGFQPNAEAIAGKSPDLVVLSNDINKIVDQLTTLKIPVLLTPAATTLDDTYQQITDLGTLTGHPSEAADVTKKMKDDIAALTKDLPQRAKKLTYYHELGPELYTATSKTFIGSIYTLAGLENIADPSDADGTKGGYPQLSQEVIVKANPDFVFLADTKCCKQTAETVKARSGWAGVTAVKNNQIVALDDDIASRWGPRVVDLVRAIVDATAKVPA